MTRQPWVWAEPDDADRLRRLRRRLRGERPFTRAPALVWQDPNDFEYPPRQAEVVVVSENQAAVLRAVAGVKSGSALRSEELTSGSTNPELPLAALSLPAIHSPKGNPHV